MALRKRSLVSFRFALCAFALVAPAGARGQAQGLTLVPQEPGAAADPSEQGVEAALVPS